MKKIHLLCNAHLDPVWQWEWEEGAAAAISTFRAAADFCEEYDGFVFNHNEVILYQWIEEYDPALFQRIQELVKKGRWNIIGGWYLQPDCNMPSGESFIRQILMGRKYFKEKFGAEPKTAINFDSFGHSRGLVQILRKCGFDSYVFMRPVSRELDLPGEDFVWVGTDGSEVIGHRIYPGYNSFLGKAAEKINQWIDVHKDKPVGLIAWGVGNHGGGPSRIDLDNIAKMMESNTEYEIVHSTPEAYFEELMQSSTKLPKYEKDLNPNQVGCYTSQIRIKQKHRLLENETFMVEKLLSSASIQGFLQYPEQEMHEVMCDLATAQFHDILPGSSVQPVEESSLRIMDHGLELLSRLKTRAFFALTDGQSKAKEGEIPVLIYNPHPFKVDGIFECEFVLVDQNWGPNFAMPVLYQNGKKIECQVEKELSNLNFLDWRKKISFRATLEPSQMNRLECFIEYIPEKPKANLYEENGRIIFNNGAMEFVINCRTGLVDRYCIHGEDYLREGSFQALVIEDNDDVWGMAVYTFATICGRFELMSGEDCARAAGIDAKYLQPVRVIEDGEVRTVIEVMLSYGNSFICQTYKLPKKGTEVQLQLRVNWNEKSKMLKLSVPTVFNQSEYYGQTAYGINRLPEDRSEAVAQKWVAAIDHQADKMLTLINDGVYGSDFMDGEIRMSLLRSPGYTGHPAFNDTGFDLSRAIMPQDRYSTRIDIGERLFDFWLNGGNHDERLHRIDREATLHNERPFVLSAFPAGSDKLTKTLIELSDETVQLAAFKKSETTEDYVIRLFEPTGQKRVTTVKLPVMGVEEAVALDEFEIVTLKLNIENKTLKRTSILDEVGM